MHHFHHLHTCTGRPHLLVHPLVTGRSDGPIIPACTWMESGQARLKREGFFTTSPTANKDDSTALDWPTVNVQHLGEAVSVPCFLQSPPHHLGLSQDPCALSIFLLAFLPVSLLPGHETLLITRSKMRSAWTVVRSFFRCGPPLQYYSPPPSLSLSL